MGTDPLELDLMLACFDPRDLKDKEMPRRPAREVAMKRLIEELGEPVPPELSFLYAHAGGCEWGNYARLKPIVSNDKCGALQRYGGELHFPWELPGWFPVADDWCGDLYVLRLGALPRVVAFVDQEDFGKIAYVVASSLSRFVHGFVRPEDRPEIFDRASAVEADPGLAIIDGLPMPWDQH